MQGKNKKKQFKKQQCPARKGLQLERLESRTVMAGDMVLDWNDVLIQTIRQDTTSPGPTWASRNGAIVQAAVFDAVNAIDGTYQSYLPNIQLPAGVNAATASKEAAAAAAAHQALLALYPAQKAYLDQRLVASLAQVVDGKAENDGVAIGRAIANQELALRVNDGSNVQGTYTVTNLPGHWSPDPTLPTTQKPLGVAWGGVKPFAMDNVKNFNIAPPPALTSAEYAAAFNEVKSLGAKNSTTRTADQTQIGVFWAYDRGGMGPPMHIYNQTAQTILKQMGGTLVDNARSMALVNIAMGDAGIACWYSKYAYDFWRPVTGVRGGNIDGNPNTIGDANWVPLGAPGGGVVPDFTPPFPAYSSGHSTFGAATFKMLENILGGGNFRFTLKSDELPGVTRSYNSLSEASYENAISRIYLGIHWKFDATAGIGQGNKIADHVFKNYLQPKQAAGTVGFILTNGQVLNCDIPNTTTNTVVRKVGNNIQVANLTNGQIYLTAAANTVASIRIDTRLFQNDVVTVDYSSGPFAVPGGINIVQGIGENDQLIVNGTAGGDTITMNARHIYVSGNSNINLLSGVNRVTVKGLAGNDSFVYTADTAKAGMNVTFDGGVGGDSMTVYGTSANETADLTVNNVRFSSSFFNVTGLNAENVLMTASTGTDEALFRDNIGNETFYGSPNSARRVGAGYEHRAEGFDRNEAFSNLAGYDIAYLYDSAGNDELIGDPAYSLLKGVFSGIAFETKVNGFELADVTANKGGWDFARLFDSAGNDTFTAGIGWNFMTGTNYNVTTRGFDQTDVAANRGGYDVAYFNDLLTADEVYGRGNHASARRANFKDNVWGFDKVVATAGKNQKPKRNVTAVDYIFQAIGTFR